ncbi:mitochondrial inner membrane protein OXA1L-like [Pollicipes pollicipes]|uniref:mitochondrial inner membrane protein OXA1L-like n=1 Tax=Pollicipes pollicipes TaxID=41117 RepID=UPI00188513F4|nr:mitochondrial inner membrane protein OXA1L-like [Pollicipes pollicipes]
MSWSIVAGQQLNALGEPALASLGLGGWTPPGLFQQFFEMLHVSAGLPWWGAIAVGTVVIRLCVFPLVVRSQKNAVTMNNNLPRMQALQVRMTEARQMGNEIEASRWTNELIKFMKEKDINPLKSLLVPMAQIPIFVSVFFGLRKMANLPLMSMKDGGMLWFTDLTVPDPYYLLPAVTALTLLATIEIGADGARLPTSPNAHLVKYFLRAMPFVVFPLTINFPAAILCYWVCSNFVALGQVIFLKIPVVRTYFNIPAKIVHDQSKLPIQKKPFVQGVKESWSNMKISKSLEDRQRYDEMRFKKAGLGAVTKTYKYDPTRQTADGRPPGKGRPPSA